MTKEENHGYKFYREVLNSPKLIVAPMVDQSELPFRELCRKYGAQLCYTPMINAKGFVNSAKIRDQYLYKCSYDRPLIAQFCCNDVDTFLKAVELSIGYCDAVDINLGCPQNIASRGHYGAFLQDDWDIIREMLVKAIEKYKLPITCKIRVFKDEKKTIEYAKMIEKAGCYLLTVHGRTREMKGQFTGLADWNLIKKIKEELRIPVFANGNIQSMRDVENCLEFTKADGVMSAEGLLYNPALFKSLHVPCWSIIDEYLEICRKSSIVSNVFIKAHCFKFCQMTLLLRENQDLRTQLSKSFKIEEFQVFSNELRKRYELNENQIVQMTNLPVPHYLTQPYFRYYLKAIDHTNGSNGDNNNESTTESSNNKHKLELINEIRQNKKLKVAPNFENGKILRKKILLNCVNCENPKALSCDYNLCRICCIRNCFESEVKLSCIGHKLNVKINKKAVNNLGEIDIEKMKKTCTN